MWIPKTAEELERQVEKGVLQETTILDFKREIGSKSKDVAIDVAAMTVDGGVLCYGVGEDANKRPTVPCPFPLADHKERIDAIVQSSILEPPEIDIVELPKQNDPSIGYLLTVVPASPRAPHMVVVRGDHRFYGRGATGNVLLTEGQVASLYARRENWEQDRDDLLDQSIAKASLQRHPSTGYLYLVARPLPRDREFLARAGAVEDVALVRKLVGRAGGADVFGRSSGNFVEGRNPWKTSDGWKVELGASTESRTGGDVVDLEIDFDGEVRLSCDDVTHRADAGGVVLLDHVVAEYTVRLLSLVGDLCSMANYYGAVDLGLAILHIQGVYPSSAIRGVRFLGRQYDKEEYKETSRRISARLLAEPRECAGALLARLYRAVLFDGPRPWEQA